MTRKKSNVKALALAVTCAILAGGYSGLNPVYAKTLTITLPEAGTLTAAGDGSVTGSFSINSNPLAKVLDENLSDVSISSGGITLGALANNVQAITYTASTGGASAKTTIDSDTEINGELTAKEKLTLSHANDDGSTTYGSLDYKEMGQLSQLLKNTTGNKTVIDAGDGSKVGGVEFNAGAVTGVKSINGTSDKFSVDENGKLSAADGKFQVNTDGTLKFGYFKVTESNDGVTFTDTNREGDQHVTIREMVDASNKTKGMSRYSENDRHGTPRNVTAIESQVKIRGDGRVEINTTGSNSEQSVVIDSGAGILVGHQNQVKKLLDQDVSVTDEQKKAYLNKTAGISYDGVFAGGIKFDEAKAGMSNVDGSLKAADGKFKVNADGSISAANNAFRVDDMGTVTGANDSKLGYVGFKDGKLYSTNDDTKAVAVSELITDHSIVNNADYGNLGLDKRVQYVETQTKGVKRLSQDVYGTTRYSTSIENTLEVYENGTVTINENAANNAVTINSKGIKVGNNSAFVSEDGFKTSGDLYVGTKTSPTEDATDARFYVKGEDGSVKAADGQFEINQHGDVTATGKITSGKLAVGTNGTEFDVDENGNIIAKGFLKAADGNFEVNTDGNVTTKGTLKAADGKFDVDADGNVTASGQLRSTKLAAGTNGDEFVVDENGNVFSKGTLSTAGGKFDVDKDGAIKAADGKFAVDADGNVTASGKLRSTKLAAGTNGDEFTVDENGNVVAKGTLSAADGKFDVDKDGAIKAADGKFTVDADGAVSAAGGNFGVDKDGNTTVGGTLNVTGATTLGSTLDVTGKTTLKDELQVDKKATFGSAAGSQTVINGGDITADGQLNVKSARIGGVNGVGISDSGVITGVTKLTTKALEVTDDLVVSGDITGQALKGTSLAITGNGTIGGSLGVTGAITGATINGATITTDSFNGAKISSNKFNGVTLDTNGDISGKDVNATGKINGATITDNSFNGVTMSNGNVTGGTITGTTVTDGAGASMNAGTVTANKFTDGQGFTANGGNVNAKDVTATGTVTGTTLTDGVATMKGGKVTAQNGFEVDANNSLTSSGLKAANIDAAKATIGKIKIEGSKITSTEADGTVGLAGITVNDAGAVNNVTSIDGVAVTGSTASGLTVGSGATAVTIGGNSMALSSTNFGVDNDGDVTGQSFTAGNSYLKDGELKLNDANIWTTAEGIKAEKATIGANTLDSTGFSTTGTLGVAGKATFGSNAGDSTTIEQGAVSVKQNGKTTTIKGGEIETDKLTVNDIVLKNSMQDGAGNTITISGSDGSMSVASGAFAVDKEGQLTNKITGTEGGYTYATNLATSKTGINANYTNGNNNLLSINKDGVALGVTDSTNQKLGGFAANEDNASLSYGDDNSIVVDETTITSALGSDVSTTLTNDGTDQSIISKVTDNATSTIKADSIEDKVGTAKRSLTEAEILDEVAGMTVKTNADGTTFTDGTTSTNIKGSSITSTNGAATGVLDGSNLTLNDGTNETKLTAGGASFTGAAGEKGGTTTTIDGGTITTDTLNVERINLGGELLDSNGNPAGGNLSMDKEGNFSAAGGNFKVTGGSGADKGAMTNTVGNTTLKTDTAGAGMSYDNGSVKSNVSVGDNNANVSAGAGSIDVTNESITSKVTDNATSTITKDSITDKVGGTTVETKDGSFSVKGNGGNGMNIDTNTGKTTFTGASGTTTIDGSTITTGKLITDELVITGQGDAAGDGKGSLAFGGNGTIKSDVKDGSDKNTQFTTDIDGVTTKVTDGTNTTTNEVVAAGNTNTVTDGTATSKNTQTATSIGGVITNGTVKIAQTLDGENGTITNEVTDKDGKSSKLEQNGTGLTYTDSTNADNATRIDSKDVSIGSATDDSKRINLSDLGQIDDLDTELSARDEFKDNPTAVGGINAEAAARRADVARLDNRIDDVNERVDKVGAMAAAIASLKSIGYDPQAPSEFSVGLGQYKGETGVALGFFHYPNKNFMINVSLSTAGGETMGGIGATWRFGHKSPQKLLDEQREAQAKKELAAAEKYKAAAQLAKEAQERAEYAAKLARQAQVSADNAKAAADATQAKHFK